MLLLAVFPPELGAGSALGTGWGSWDDGDGSGAGCSEDVGTGSLVGSVMTGAFAPPSAATDCELDAGAVLAFPEFVER